MASPLRILLIDQDSDMEKLVQEEMLKAGFTCQFDSAHQLHHIASKTESGQIELVIMDDALNEPSVADVLDLITQQGSDIPVIVLTSQTAPDSAVHAMRAGACDYILKHEPHRLAATVARELRDVTARRERRHAFRALRKSEERFRAAVERSLHAFFVLECVRDENGEISAFIFRYLNEQAQRMLGGGRSELIGRDFVSVVGDEAGQRFQDAFKRVVREGKAVGGERHIAGKGLPVQWIHEQIVPLSDGVAVTLADISERKESQQQLDRFFSMSLAMLFILDEQGRFIRLNPVFETTLGWPITNLQNHSFLEIIDETDRQKVATQLQRLMHGMSIQGFEVHVRRADGSTRLLSLTMVSVLSQRIIYGVAQDVTDRIRAATALRESEMRYRTIVEDQAEWIARFSPEGAISFMNRAMEEIVARIHGQGPNPNLFNLLPSSHRGLFLDAIDTLQKDGDVVDIECPLEVPMAEADTVELRQIEWKVRLLAPTWGEGWEYQAVARDMTQYRRGQEERTRLETELRHAQKMEALGTLASGVAHDFSNLMTVILGYTDMAHRALPENHEAAEYIRSIEKVTNRATGVTNSLLTFSQRRTSEKKPVNLCELLEDSIRLLRRVVPAGVAMELESEQDEVWVQADDTQLTQVLMNLALNARDAMPQGGTLRFKLDTPAADQNHLVLIVSDTGVGMDEETSSRIFEPFFTTKARERGTGLGLAIVHSIVEDHEGEITVESEVGQGTTFTITLPRSDAPAEDESFKRPDLSQLQGKYTVLVVEDDSFVRSIIVSALEDEGITCIEASDGVEAIEYLNESECRFCLIIMDVDLPKMSGFEVARQLAGPYGQTPIIFMTGNPEYELDNAMDRPCVMIRKPFPMMDLIERVQYFLEAPSSSETSL